MSSFTLNIEHPKDQSWPTDTVKHKGDLIRLAEMIAAGHLTGDTVDLHTSASNLVAASGTVGCVLANVDANDTVTIGGVTLTAKASGANGTTEFNAETSNTVMATNLKNCINANTTLSKHLLATSSSGTVTVTARLKGSIGNLITLASSDADGLVVSGTALTGGTGGPESAAQALER
jgi:phage tail sheath gpL-like